VVDIQHALFTLTAIPQADQILMFNGSRLDPSYPISQYQLPTSQQHDIFLYNKALIRPGAPPPPLEPIPSSSLPSSVPSLLSSSHAPITTYTTAIFNQHVQTASTLLLAIDRALSECNCLLGEQEVQAMSADAATNNAESHYSFVSSLYSTFMGRYSTQQADMVDLVRRFDADLAFLQSTELHPGLVVLGVEKQNQASTRSIMVKTRWRRLVDLVDVDKLKAAEEVARQTGHHLGPKISTLQSLFDNLCSDMEALFMSSPSVDLAALSEAVDNGREVREAAEGALQALKADAIRAESLLSSSDNNMNNVNMDSRAALEAMFESHITAALPQITAAYKTTNALLHRCINSKNTLSLDVQCQLQTISSQQSRIKELKDRLTAYSNVLDRQEVAIRELKAARATAGAYKQCLAECVRRAAFAEKYSLSAARLAENMGKFREKEEAMRKVFMDRVILNDNDTENKGGVPLELLEHMGLLYPPPHCQVTIPSSSSVLGGREDSGSLLHVTLDDVHRFVLPWSDGTGSDILPTGGGMKNHSDTEATTATAHQYDDIGDDSSMAFLRFENARLRADLASLVALECSRRGGGGGGTGGSDSAAAILKDTSTTGVTSSSVSSSTVSAWEHELSQKFEKALSTKDAFSRQLQSDLAASRHQAIAYKSRIQELEAQLTTLVIETRSSIITRNEQEEEVEEAEEDTLEEKGVRVEDEEEEEEPTNTVGEKEEEGIEGGGESVEGIEEVCDDEY
jgi:hypothetical protein